jgi:hypothetical protein
MQRGMGQNRNRPKQMADGTGRQDKVSQRGKSRKSDQFNRFEFSRESGGRNQNKRNKGR